MFKIFRISRRTRKTLGILAIPIIGLLVYGGIIEPAMLEVTRHEVRIPNLPKEFDGMTVVQLSDIHVGVWTRPKHVRRIVQRVNDMHPDMVVLTGDYVNMVASNIEPAGSSLAGIKSKYGVYAVLGNHDYWADAGRMTRSLRKSGIDVLFNEKRRISDGRSHIRMVGLDDAWEGDTDYAKAFDGIPRTEPCIAIAHNPDTVSSIKDQHVDLLLVGHTHGGLINLPFTGPFLSVTNLGPKYSAGMFRFGDTNMYVSRGMGQGTGSHFRFRCHPEIPVFILRQ